jgi:hypothetical protein
MDRIVTDVLVTTRNRTSPQALEIHQRSDAPSHSVLENKSAPHIPFTRGERIVFVGTVLLEGFVAWLIWAALHWAA